MDNEYGTAVVDDAVAVAEATEADTTTAEVLDESPEERIARLEAENAKFKEAEKRREAGKKGAENSLKKERDEALQRAAEYEQRLAALEQKAQKQEQAVQQQQFTASVDQRLAKRRTELEYQGASDELIDTVLKSERKAIEAEAKAEQEQRQRAFVQWTNDRKDKVAEVVKQRLARVSKRYELNPDANVVIGRLKRHVFEPQALGEIYEQVDAYFDELMDAADADREQAGRTANAQARKAENPDVMADGGSGARSPREIWRGYANGDPSISDADARKAYAALRAAHVLT